MKNVLEMLKKNETSIRQISKVTGCTYGNLLKGSKKPIKGETYDPSAINEDEIIRIVKAKLGTSFENFDWSEIENTTSTPRTKTDVVDYEVGELMMFKRGHGKADPSTIYTVIFETESHVVLNPNIGTEPRVIAKTTLKLFGAYNVDRQPVEQESAQISTSEDDDSENLPLTEDEKIDRDFPMEVVETKKTRRSSKK